MKDQTEGVFLLGSRFEQQAAQYPEAPAVTCQGASVSYAELNRRANQLAACLQQSGIGPDALVGIRLDRSIDLLVGIMAILKAGGAYLPLDLASPPDRVAFMLEDSGAQVLLTDSRLASGLTGYAGKTICLDQLDLAPYSAANPVTSLRPDNLAYVIYTSGSTGKPKGVLVTHENVSRLFSSTDAWFQFGPSDVWTLFHSCAFDFSVWEIFGALLYGGRLVVVPYDVSRSAVDFHQLLVREKVTVLNQTPSAFRQLIHADQKGPKADLALRFVIFGGEALEYPTLAPWFARYGAERPRCINMYGITETTVHVTYHPITAREVESGSPSNIGVPIPDLQVHLMAPDGQPVASGEVGEMWVGGRGVARGYLNRADLTKDRFVPDPSAPGDSSARLYRSGDSARRLPNGDLEYLGRIDQQVKIRGFRIELSEIEAVLARSAGVRQCAVVARSAPGEEPRLIGYVVADPNASPTVEALRTHLAQKLPEYMVPAAYVFLDSFPLTINGKLDRDKLPAPGSDRPRLAVEYAAPKDELEESLAKIWRSVLRLDAVGTQDNFFNLGGDSLSAMNMLAQVEKSTGRKVGIRPMLESATIEHLAIALRTTEPDAPPPMMILTQAGNGKRPLFFAHGDYVFGGFYCQKLAQRIGLDQTFYSLAPHGAFGGDAPPTIEEMAASYVDLIRSIQPHGPYYLGGFCNGAVTMYEVAQQLTRAGETVAMLSLLDPPDLYFFILRRRIMQVGKFLGQPEARSRNIYQRTAEGVEIWKDHGSIAFFRAAWTRGIQWMARRAKGGSEFPAGASAPNLNFHYYEALAIYEPVAYLSSSAVQIILREGESDRHPKQVSYWSGFIPDVYFEVIPGTHLELQTSMNEVAAIIRRVLNDLPPGPPETAVALEVSTV